MAELCANPVPEFWPDDVSSVDPRSVDASPIHRPGQVTDFYLLTLAVRRGGRVVSFDTEIALSAVKGASVQHLLAL